jgi:hypothetical protein
VATRFDIRIDDESILLVDDAAAVIYLIGKLASADEIERVLLAAEITRSKRIEGGTWNPSPDLAEFGAAVRRDLFTPDDLPNSDPDLFVGASYKPGHDSDLAF